VALRYEILRKPLGLEYSAEQLSEEWKDIHLSCYSDHSELIGCLILSKTDDKTLKMRQVAVKEKVQGRGVGKKLVETSEAYALLNGFEKIELHAREAAIPFYLVLDYKIVGDVFLEVGIAHKKMVKKLKVD
jgi:predicted GNAT family N-acyltransferase